VFINAYSIGDNRLTFLENLCGRAILAWSIKFFIDSITFLVLPITKIILKIIVGLNNIKFTINNSDIKRNLLK